MFAVTLVSTGTQAALSERVSGHLVPARGYVRNAQASVLSWADDGASFILSDGSSQRSPFSALPAAALEIELSESLILKERESATATLSALKALGVHVAIDDFGTGYSWYGYLRYFMPNTLKIDRSFVLNISQNTFDEAIAKAMILLGHSLGLTVVAEGIEDRNQVLTLRKLDCDELQGYFFARPANAEACERMLSDPNYITDLLA